MIRAIIFSFILVLFCSWKITAAAESAGTKSATGSVAETVTDEASTQAIAYADKYAAYLKTSDGAGAVESPVEYFKKNLESPQAYRRSMAKIAERLGTKSLWASAAEAWLEVLVATSDANARFEAALKWSEAVRKSKASMKDRLRFVEQAVMTVQELRGRGSRGDGKIGKKEATQIEYLEVAVRDTVTRMQQSVRDKGQIEDFASVVRGYEFYQIGFPQQSENSKIQVNRAESLFRAQEWSRAGLEFESLSAASKSAEKKAEFRESAIQAYVKALNDSDNATPLALVRARRGVREVGTSWLAKNLRHPAAASTAYNIGQSWYEDRAYPQAIKAFNFFLEKFNKDSRCRDAIFMIINSYSQKEDFRGLIRASKKLVKLPALSDDDQKAIRELMRRAQLKDVQTIAGAFGTKEYAANLLELASKHKDSSLGATALYEAFTSMNSKHEPEMFEVGESLLDKFPNAAYTKNVAGSMVKAALLTADFERAAKYMTIYSSRYPTDPESSALRKNAAQISEWLGDFKEATRLYRNLGDVESVARCDFLAGDWKLLEGSSTKINPALGLYYYALSLWRQGRQAEALPRLKQLSTRPESEHSAHARFLLAQRALDDFRAIQMKDANDQSALVAKVKSFQALSKELNDIVRIGAGKWTIAALYLLGQTNLDLGRFIATSPIPLGLQPNEVKVYRRALAKQAKEYGVASTQNFKLCLETAEKFEVFTRYAKGCRMRGKLEVKEESDTIIAAPEKNNSTPKTAAELRKKLYESPGDTKTLTYLAAAYVQERQYWTATAIYNRALELDPRNAEAMAGVGISRLFLNDLEGAALMFKKALAIAPNEPTAAWNLAGLYREFGFASHSKELASKRPKGSRPVLLHPMAEKL